MIIWCMILWCKDTLPQSQLRAMISLLWSSQVGWKHMLHPLSPGRFWPSHCGDGNGQMYQAYLANIERCAPVPPPVLTEAVSSSMLAKSMIVWVIHSANQTEEGITTPVFIVWQTIYGHTYLTQSMSYGRESGITSPVLIVWQGIFGHTSYPLMFSVRGITILVWIVWQTIYSHTCLIHSCLLGGESPPLCGLCG